MGRDGRLICYTLHSISVFFPKRSIVEERMYRGKVLLLLHLQKAVLWPKLLKREFKKRLIILQFGIYSNKEQSYSLLSIISLDCPILVNSAMAMALGYPH